MNDACTTCFIDNRKVLNILAYKFSLHRAVVRDNAIDVEDLFQEASIAFLRAYNSHNEDRSQLTTHVTNVVTNYLTDFLRSLSRVKRQQDYNFPEIISLEDLSEEDEPVSPYLIATYETREAINYLLDKHLSSRDCQIFRLFFGLGDDHGECFTAEEIAAEFGLSQRGVSYILQNALSSDLRAELLEVLCA